MNIRIIYYTVPILDRLSVANIVSRKIFWTLVESALRSNELVRIRCANHEIAGVKGVCIAEILS